MMAPQAATAQVSDDELDRLRAQAQRTATAESRAASEATRAARAESTAASEFERRVQADADAADAAITAADAEATRLEGEYATAMEEGKFADAAKAQRLLARAEQAKANAETRKADIAAFRERNAREAEARAAARPAPSQEPDLSHLSQPQQTWIRAHPEFVTDAAFQRRAIAAAQYAVEFEGHAVDSPEYFKYVEDRLGLTKKAAPEPDAEPETPPAEEETDEVTIETPAPARQAAPPAAPVSRRPAAPAPARTGKVTLTAQQAEAALASFPDDKPADAYRMYAEGQRKLRERGVPGF